MLNSADIFLVATLLPLAGAIILALLHRHQKNVSAYLATGFILLSLAITVFGVVEHISHSLNNALPLSATSGLPWIPLAATAGKWSQALSWGRAAVMSDSLTAMMFMIILVLAVPGQIFLMMYLKRRDEPPYFYALVCLLVFAALAACLCPNMLALMALVYFTAIISTLLLAALIRPGHGVAASRSLGLLSAGMAFFLVGLALLNARAGFGTGEMFTHAGVAALGPHLQTALGLATYQQVLHFRGGPFAAGLSWLTWSGVGLLLFSLALAGQFPFQALPLETLEAPSPINGLLTGAILPLLSIYMIARLYPLFTLNARLIMAIAGCTSLGTAFLAAWAQRDIKRMTWWIVGGQFGWCFLLFGVGAWVEALFHALLWATLALGLFLVNGAVLGATNGRSDVRTLGGLWRKLPLTTGAALVFVVIGSQVLDLGFHGTLPRNLFWLHRYGEALGEFGQLLYWVPLGAVFFSSLALWRWWWLIFVGTGRQPGGSAEVSRESAVLTLPLVLLAVLTVGLHEPFFGIKALLAHAAPRHFAGLGLWPVAGPAVPIGMAWCWWAAIGGAIIAVLLYFRGMGVADRLRRIPGINLLYIWTKGEFFMPEITLFIPGMLAKAAGTAAKFVDRIVLELLLIFSALFVRVAGMLVGAAEQVWSGGVWDRLTTLPAPRWVRRFLRSGRVQGVLIIALSAGLLAAAVLAAIALA